MQLDPKKTYLSPAGRMCKVVPQKDTEGQVHFVYLSREGDREAEDGFSLRDSSVQALRKFTVVGEW